MRGVDAPDDATKSFVARGNAEADRDASDVALDEEGLPLVYDRAAIQAYWAKQGGALQKRWAEFLGLSVPFLTRVATLSITGGAEELSKNDRSLARDARVIIEKLGPTYIKAGQMMSVRPDVLPQAALDEGQQWLLDAEGTLNRMLRLPAVRSLFIRTALLFPDTTSGAAPPARRATRCAARRRASRPRRPSTRWSSCSRCS